jgi:hypothetical protein
MCVWCTTIPDAYLGFLKPPQCPFRILVAVQCLLRRSPFSCHFLSLWGLPLVFLWGASPCPWGLPHDGVSSGFTRRRAVLPPPTREALCRAPRDLLRRRDHLRCRLSSLASNRLQVCPTFWCLFCFCFFSLFFSSLIVHHFLLQFSFAFSFAIFL